MFLKCLKYKKSSFINPLHHHQPQNIKPISTTINTQPITPNESSYSTEISKNPLNTSEKTPLTANTLKCTKNISENPTFNEDSPLPTEENIASSKDIYSLSKPVNNSTTDNVPLKKSITYGHENNSAPVSTIKKSNTSKVQADTGKNLQTTPIAPVSEINSNTIPLAQRDVAQYLNIPANFKRQSPRNSHNISNTQEKQLVDNSLAPANNLANTSNSNFLKNPLPIISKSLHTENDTVVLLFSCQVNIMLSYYIRILFTVKRYSSEGQPLLLGSSHIFSSFGNSDKCKSFSFQLLDTDLTPGRYTYSIEAYSNCFKQLPLGLIIINPHITLITGNQF